MISQSDRREAEMNQLNARLGELARRLQYEATHDGLDRRAQPRGHHRPRRAIDGRG